MDNDILSQASQAALRGERLSRERAAYLYTCAMDRGDWKKVCEIRDRAEHDPELEEILTEIDESIGEEEEVHVTDEERERVHAKVKHLMKQYYEEI